MARSELMVRGNTSGHGVALWTLQLPPKQSSISDSSGLNPVLHEYAGLCVH
jgi:hypothetical protein